MNRPSEHTSLTHWDDGQNDRFNAVTVMNDKAANLRVELMQERDWRAARFEHRPLTFRVTCGPFRYLLERP